jgi:hypothetical protein
MAAVGGNHLLILYLNMGCLHNSMILLTNQNTIGYEIDIENQDGDIIGIGMTVERVARVRMKKREEKDGRIV